MNKKIFILMVLLPVFVLSQSKEFDLAYLDSLPDSVRSDVQKELEKNLSKQTEEESYKIRPSTELLKSQIVRDWEQFKRERDSLENQSERYGINLFRTMQSSFMPINEPNFGNNYILDYGDEIQISLYGNIQEQTLDLEIKRDGSVFIPELGSITLAGFSYQDAVNKISKRIENSYIGVEVEVNMMKTRDVKILISGQVEFPGIYTLSGNSNVLQAINIAGGIKENGTLRDIEIKRDGQIISNVDIYEALIFGDISNINQLQSGDAIYVKPSIKLVRAGSGFVNEALFELKENETIEDLLLFSGGIIKNVTKLNYTLHRFSESSFETLEIDSNNLSNFKLRHLDSIYLPVTNYGSVKITGEVARPGTYTISSSDDIYDLVQRAGGYTADAYQYGGILKTQKAKELEESYFEKAYNNLISFIVQNPTILSQGNGGTSALGLILEEIKNVEPSGRVVAEFDLFALEEDPLKRKILQDKDELHIPSLDNVVYVYGEVNNPSAQSFKDFATPLEYITLSGGLTRYADESYVYIVNPNGEANIMQLGRLKQLLSVKDIDLFPGSLIYVPKKIGISQNVQLASTIAPIFSSLALSIASLNSIND